MHLKWLIVHCGLIDVFQFKNHWIITEFEKAVWITFDILCELVIAFGANIMLLNQISVSINV